MQNTEYDSTLPKPFSDSWREAYRYTEKDLPRKAHYQAPTSQPVEFILDTIQLAGGQSLETAEYPFYGFWSNTSLNEKPHTIRISGHIGGTDYIAWRNELITALQVPTSDDICGYIELPLWGRFALVVSTWEVEEAGKENGQCKISITCTRAGWAEAKRLKYANRDTIDMISTVAILHKTAAAAFIKTLSDKTDMDTLVSGFSTIKETLAGIVGRVQGAKNTLNEITNKVNSISTLIAQGIRSPAELVHTLIGATIGVATGILEIKNAITDTTSYFSQYRNKDDQNESSETTPEQFIKSNTKNALMQFLTTDKYTIEEEAITEAQQITKKAIENVYRTISYGICALLLTELDTAHITYNKQSGLWTLFERLETSINKEDSTVYAAIESVRIATAHTLLSQNASVELAKEITDTTPLLALALYLSCTSEQIRTLNTIANSFLIKGAVIYV